MKNMVDNVSALRALLRDKRLILGALLLAATPLIAQNEAAAGGGVPTNGNITLEECVDDSSDIASMDQEQYLPKGDEYLSTMRTRLTTSLSLLRKAREDKDAIRLTCVNEKVAKLKGLLRVAENAYVALQEAKANQDLERMRYEFQKIRAAWLKMCELYNAAANCVGVGAPYIGEGSITFEDNGGVVWDPYFGDVSIFFDPSNGLTNNPIRIGNNNPPIVISVYQENG